jgi:hypothetical protein
MEEVMNDEMLRLAKKKDLWEIRVKEVDFFYKVIILIIGSIIAGCFVWVQYQQTQSRYYVDLMSQRERADVDLRAQMFNTLFEAYFLEKIKVNDSKQSQVNDSKKMLEGLHQEIILLDLLARNFENIDVRPLFEDLDQRLVQLIKGDVREMAKDALKQRQQLRRMAAGATARQVAALEGLGENAARVTYHSINTCKKGNDKKPLIDLLDVKLPDEIATASGPISITRLGDGVLDMSINTVPKIENTSDNDSSAGVINISVTFFDMPALENLRLDNNKRVAFSIYKYLSSQDCTKEFKEYLDYKLQIDCDSLLNKDKELEEQNECAFAQFRAVIMPENFLGIHDRPYVNELAAGKYRDSWWKFW